MWAIGRVWNEGVSCGRFRGIVSAWSCGDLDGGRRMADVGQGGSCTAPGHEPSPWSGLVMGDRSCLGRGGSFGRFRGIVF